MSDLVHPSVWHLVHSLVDRSGTASTHRGGERHRSMHVLGGKPVVQRGSLTQGGGVEYTRTVLRPVCGQERRTVLTANPR